MTSWDLGGNVITGPTQYLGTQTNNNQPLAISTNGVERVRVDTNGNVGIGTAAPKSKLQINGLTAIDEGPTAAGAWTNLGSNSYYDGAWKRLDTTKAGVSLHMNADDVTGQELRFHREEADGSNPRNLAVFGSQTSYILSGNVGIHTMGPQANLHVAKNNNYTTVKFGDDKDSASNALNGLGFVTYTDGNNYIDSKTYSGGYTYFRTGQGTETENSAHG